MSCSSEKAKSMAHQVYFLAMAPSLAPSLDELRRLRAVARGEQAAEVVVSGGRLVNVFTEEVLPGWGVAISGGRVAYVGPDAEDFVSPGTQTFDAQGGYIAPGLVECHTHMQRVDLLETATLQVKAGITTTVLETVEIAYMCGPDGMRALLGAAAVAPGRILLTVPPLVGLDAVHEAELAPAEAWIKLLDDPGVAGVGEIYWPDLLRGHERAERLAAAALERGLPVEGHGAGIRFANLVALAAAGVASDHEALTADETLLRLRLGLYALARHGATRQDLDAIAPIWGGDADLSRLALVTDGVEPDSLASGRSLNSVVDAAVTAGLPLARAVRMASRTPAEHFGLGRWLGGLAPGMQADLVVLAEDARFQPRQVLVGGKPPAKPDPFSYPSAMRDTVQLGDIDAGLLQPPPPGRRRAMQFVAPLVTREAESVDGGLVCAVLDRTGRERGFRGLLLGTGIAGAAVALSSGWESPAVVVVADGPPDARVAVERVRSMRGGAAVAAGGQVVAEWQADIAGVQSTAGAGAVADEVAAVNNALREFGCEFPNPLLSLETLTSPAIPHLRITADGYVRLKDGARLGLDIT
jgi:adenine deaminase